MTKYTIILLILVETYIFGVAFSTNESSATELISPPKYSTIKQLPPQIFWVPDYSTTVDLDTELIPLSYRRKL